jgi:cell fate regulator YaaT (PSP1 superfamily)
VNKPNNTKLELMTMDKLIQEVLKIIQQELDGANKKYPEFRSNEEALGVIREEYKEARQEMKLIKKHYKLLDNDLCLNHGEYSQARALNLKKCTIKAICELVQLSAMCQKFEKGDDET